LAKAFRAILLRRDIHYLAFGAFDPPDLTSISQLPIKSTPDISQPPIILETDPALMYPAPCITQFHSHFTFLQISIQPSAVFRAIISQSIIM